MWLCHRVSMFTYHVSTPWTGFASTATTMTASSYRKPFSNHFSNGSSWQCISYWWKSLFFLLNVTTFVSKMHLWHEPQSRPMDSLKICQIFSASASLFCNWLLFWQIGRLKWCGGTRHSHNSVAAPPHVGHQPGQTRWQSNCSICRESAIVVVLAMDSVAGWPHKSWMGVRAAAKPCSHYHCQFQEVSDKPALSKCCHLGR